MTWEIRSSTVFARLKGTVHNKTKYVVHNSDTNRNYVVLHWPGIPCVVYDLHMDELLGKYSWWYSRPTGYMYAHNTSAATPGDTASVTMHAVIMRNLQGSPESDTTSVDHMNYIKTFNTCENLRYVNQSEQNTNRQNRIDKAVPPKELQDIGIHSLPRHVRYDKSENKFVIERKHPGIAKLTEPFNYSGTKSKTVSMIYKYYDVLNKLDFLNKLMDTPERQSFIQKQNTLYQDYCDISKLVTGIDVVDRIQYDNTECDYKSLEKYLTDAEREYERRGLPENCEVNVNDLPKYCCYEKPKCKHGELFYISHRHPNLKAIDAKSIKTTSSKNVTIECKYKELRDILEIVDKNEGENLRTLLTQRLVRKKDKTTSHI